MKINLSPLRRGLIILTAAVAAITTCQAQELNCQVEVNADKIQATNKQVFETLKGVITDYFNNTKFSNAQFSPNEKIECRVMLTVSEWSDNNHFTGDIQIQASRPVYNTNYTTTLINFRDTKVEFDYQEGEQLVFSQNNMESQLTAILNFYAYLILATDFDSFAPKGGEPFFDQLKQIVQLAQSSGETGWKAFEDNKNRSAVLSAYTDASTAALRDLTYEYHRTGLDEMSTAPDKGRAKITSALEKLSAVYSASPMSVGLSMFKDAKLDELVNIYSKAPQTERDKAYDILREIYPTENERLQTIKTGAVK